MTPVDPFGLQGQVLDGQFRVDDYVGEGGFCSVYRGHQLALDQTVALKFLRVLPTVDAAPFDAFIQRFRQDGRVFSKLSQASEYICRTIGSGVITTAANPKRVPYMVHEWLEGRALVQELEWRRGQGYSGRDWPEVVSFLDPVAEALTHAHAQGLAHRELSPSSVFIARTREGDVVKVLDFGVSQFINSRVLDVSQLLRHRELVRISSPAYAAPEQFDSRLGLVGPRADVYSLALLCVEIASDRLVFDPSNPDDLVSRILDPSYKRTPRPLGIEANQAIEQLFEASLSVTPTHRPKDVGEFWRRFTEAVASSVDGTPNAPDEGPNDAFSMGGRTDPPPVYFRESSPPSVGPYTNRTESGPPRAFRTIPTPTQFSVPAFEAPNDGPARAESEPGDIDEEGTAARSYDPRLLARAGAEFSEAYVTPESLSQGDGDPATVARPYTRTSPAPSLPDEDDWGRAGGNGSSSRLGRAQQVPKSSVPFVASGGRHPSSESYLGSGAYIVEDEPAEASAGPSMDDEPLPPKPYASQWGSDDTDRSDGMYTEDEADGGQGDDGVVPEALPRKAQSANEGVERLAWKPAPKKSAKKFVVVAVAGLVAVAAIGLKVRGRATQVDATNQAETSVDTAATHAQEPAPAAQPAAATATPRSTSVVAGNTEERAPAPGLAPSTEARSPLPAPAPSPVPSPTAGGPQVTSQSSSLKGASPSPTQPATTVASASPKAPSRPVAPKPKPAGLNRGAARSALDTISSILASCKKPGGPVGSGRAVVTFEPSGVVSHVDILGAPFAGTPEGACIASRFRKAKVPTFVGSPARMDYLFTLRR